MKVDYYLIKELESYVDEKFCQFSKRIVNSPTEMLGVRVPQLRIIAKKLLCDFSLDEIMSLPDNKYVEIDYIKGFCVCYSKESISTKWNLLANLSKKWDNWAVCDSTVATLKTKVNEKTELFERCLDILKVKEAFSLRLGIVCLIDNFVFEEKIEDLAYAINFTPKNAGYYVDMAVAWLISNMLIKMYDSTKKLLVDGKLDLTDFVFNKAIQKAGESFRLSKNEKLFLKSIKK